MARINWTKYNWLIPVNPLINKSKTKWICACGSCQCERVLSYEQALNIAKGNFSRDCLDCKIKDGRYTFDLRGLEIGRSEKNQEKAIKNRRGVKRPNFVKAIEYNRLFSPECFVTVEGRKKQRSAKLGKTGSLAGRWDGGKTKENKLLRSRDDYKQLRKSVFERDDYTCQICLKRGGDLEMDHIKEWCNYPELRFNAENCRTLCKRCHRQTDNYGVKAKRKNICLTK
jgi:hypothetical protein